MFALGALGRRLARRRPVLGAPMGNWNGKKLGFLNLVDSFIIRRKIHPINLQPKRRILRLVVWAQWRQPYLLLYLHGL